MSWQLDQFRDQVVHLYAQADRAPRGSQERKKLLSQAAQLAGSLRAARRAKATADAARGRKR